MKSKEFFLLILIFSRRSSQNETNTEIPTWNGDPKICVQNTEEPNRTDPPFPIFPDRAEFNLEEITIRIYPDKSRTTEMISYRYFYDFPANKLIRRKNDNGFVDSEYFYYDIGKVSTYYQGSICVVDDIPEDVDEDGTSSIRLPDGSTHIRPLSEFLLFSRNDPRKEEIRPKFLNQTKIRGITVNLWESCIINRDRLTTERRIWAFAASSVDTPSGHVGPNGVPIEMNSEFSLVDSGDIEYFEVEKFFNFYGFRPGFVESIDELLPERTTFCSTADDQNLISLREAKIVWPNRFSVRVQPSTSRSIFLPEFRLRFNNEPERNGRIVRYDFLPVGVENFRSIIFDHAENLTFSIDERTGFCEITRIEHLHDVNPLLDPIGFFIKHERRFLLDLDARKWESNGEKACRGKSSVCRTVTSQEKNFPALVDSDIGETNGENWSSTNFEYGWTFRSPSSRSTSPDEEKLFDYPVYLTMKLFRSGGETRRSTIEENVEFEFFEMSTETNPSDFDTSLCYRSGRLEILHLFFILTSNFENPTDKNKIDRRFFEKTLHAVLTNGTNVKYSRISSIEFEHENSSNETIVIFILLGKNSLELDSEEISGSEGAERLKRVIDSNDFYFDFLVNDVSPGKVRFQAKIGSLNVSKNFISIYSTGNEENEEIYSVSSQILSVVLGTFVGLLFGTFLVVILRIVRKDPMPKIPLRTRHFSNPIVTFKAQQNSSTKTENSEI